MRASTRERQPRSSPAGSRYRGQRSHAEIGAASFGSPRHDVRPVPGEAAGGVSRGTVRNHGYWVRDVLRRRGRMIGRRGGELAPARPDDSGTWIRPAGDVAFAIPPFHPGPVGAGPPADVHRRGDFSWGSTAKSTTCRGQIPARGRAGVASAARRLRVVLAALRQWGTRR